MANAQIQSHVPEKYRPYAAQRQRQKAEVRSRLNHHQAGLKYAEDLATILKSEFGATKVMLFGSMLSARSISLWSDIDLAVRHVVRSHYTHRLDPEQIVGNLEKLPDCYRLV